MCVRGSWHDGPLGRRRGNSLAVTPAALRSLRCSYIGHRQLQHSHRYRLKVGFCSFSSFFFFILAPLPSESPGGRREERRRGTSHCPRPLFFPLHVRLFLPLLPFLSPRLRPRQARSEAQICKVYFTYLSGEEPTENTSSNLLSITVKADQSDLPPVEQDGSSSTNLPVGARGDTGRASPSSGEPRRPDYFSSDFIHFEEN